jgi:hypothetical protein
MGANGGEVIAAVRIDLDKPRDRGSSRFKQHVDHLTDLVRQAFYR